MGCILLAYISVSNYVYPTHDFLVLGGCFNINRLSYQCFYDIYTYVIPWLCAWDVCYIILSLIAYIFSRDFVFIITVQFMISAKSRIRFGCFMSLQEYSPNYNMFNTFLETRSVVGILSFFLSNWYDVTNVLQGFHLRGYWYINVESLSIMRSII